MPLSEEVQQRLNPFNILNTFSYPMTQGMNQNDQHG